jgi:hypothetical protein
VRKLWARSRLDTLDQSVKDAEATFGKVTGELKDELGTEFESENRLAEQKEKLAAVEKELQATGDTTEEIKEIDATKDIVEKYPDFAYLTRLVAAEGTEEVAAKIAEENAKKALKLFFYNGAEGWKVAKDAKAVTVPGWEQHRFFLRMEQSKTEGAKFFVVETSTGFSVGSGQGREATILRAKTVLDGVTPEKFIETVRKQQLKAGLSPRAAAEDAQRPELTGKFQTGQRVLVAGLDGVGTVQEINPRMASLKVAMEGTGGGVISVPMRLVEPVTGGAKLSGTTPPDEGLPGSSDEPHSFPRHERRISPLAAVGAALERIPKQSKGEGGFLQAAEHYLRAAPRAGGTQQGGADEERRALEQWARAHGKLSDEDPTQKRDPDEPAVSTGHRADRWRD